MKLSQETVNLDMKNHIVNHSLISFRSKWLDNISRANLQDNWDGNLFDEHL